MNRLRTLLLALCSLAAGSLASAESLQVGATAPVVSGTTDAGTPLNLGDLYKNNRYTLVYFYPKADTGGCTKQGCSLRDAYSELQAKGVTVVGVSTDTVEDQKKFKDKNHFPFPLIADTDKKIVKAFGQDGVAFAKRQAYLIKDGKIIYADHKGSTTKQAEDILTFLQQNGG